MDIIDAVRNRYAEDFLLREPLDDERYEKAKALFPAELAELLHESDGIEETMVIPKTGERVSVYFIVYTFDEIISETETYRADHGGDGVVFSGNGAGGKYVIKPDGKVYFREYYDEEEEFCAGSLLEFFR